MLGPGPVGPAEKKEEEAPVLSDGGDETADRSRLGPVCVCACVCVCEEEGSCLGPLSLSFPPSNPPTLNPPSFPTFSSFCGRWKGKGKWGSASLVEGEGGVGEVEG